MGIHKLLVKVGGTGFEVTIVSELKVVFDNAVVIIVDDNVIDEGISVVNDIGEFVTVSSSEFFKLDELVEIDENVKL